MILLTYAAFPLPGRDLKPYEKQSHLNEEMREFSRKSDLTLVDVRNRFLELLPEGTPREWYFATRNESHPNPTGYFEIAKLVSKVFESDIEKTLDFLDKLADADIITEEAKYVKVEKKVFKIRKDTRFVLFEHPNTKIIFKYIPIHENCELTFGIGINKDAWLKAGDGVLFELSIVDEKEENKVLFSQYIDPKNNPSDRKWFDHKIDLRDFDGQTVSFVFSTASGPKGNTYFDWAGWANPLLTSLVLIEQ